MKRAPGIPGVPGGEAALADLRARLRAALGPVGIWSFALQAHGATSARATVAALEGIGYRSAWFPETIASKEAFAHAAVLLGAGGSTVVGTGIANIYARDAMAMINGGRTLAEAHPGRFILGIGVSHAPSVAKRGAVYDRPIERMNAYLDAMVTTDWTTPEPPEVPVILAALGPRMLELAAGRTVGAHPYFVPVEHTAAARRELGPEPLLVVEVTGVLDTDRARGLETARAFAERYLALENYANNLRRLGWADEAIASGGEALLDAVVVQGDAPAIADRVRAHLDAGADHVCLQLRGGDPDDLQLDAFRAVYAALHPGH